MTTNNKIYRQPIDGYTTQGDKKLILLNIDLYVGDTVITSRAHTYIEPRSSNNASPYCADKLIQVSQSRRYKDIIAQFQELISEHFDAQIVTTPPHIKF